MQKIVGFFGSVAVFGILWGWVIQLRQNKKRGNCENLHPFMYICCGFAYSLYCAYGWMGKDIYIFAPNAAGVVLSIIMYVQMWKYRGKKSAAEIKPPVFYALGDLVTPKQLPVFCESGFLVSSLREQTMLTVQELIYSQRRKSWLIMFEELPGKFFPQDFCPVEISAESYTP